MIYVKRELTTYKATLNLGSDPDSNAVYVTLYHEYGDTVMAEAAATRDSAGVYSYTFSTTNLKSAGIHKIKWRYAVSTVTTYKEDYFTVYQPYITSSEFFNEHSELEDAFGDTFDSLERRVAKIIDTHCGQSFSPKISKTLSIDGDDQRTLWLPERLDSFTEVLMIETGSNTSTTSDYTTYVEAVPQTKFCLRWKNPNAKFPSTCYMTVKGNWGWPYVPVNVTQAADLILVDLMNDDSTYRQHGITEVYMDSHRVRFDKEILGSTGNLDADVLLMDYTLFLLTLI